MATVYKRKDSPYLYLRRKRGGKWVSERTEWKAGDRAGERKAKELCARLSLEDLAEGHRSSSGEFEQWVGGWLLEKYGARKTTTLAVYTARWAMLTKFLKLHDYKHPKDITREMLSEYRSWRAPENQKRNHGAGVNTVIGEIRTLGVVLREAKARGYCRDVVTDKLGWRKEEQREYEPWTDDEIARALEKSQKLPENQQWIRAALILGAFQASRLRQCAVPLSAIDFERGMIFWPKGIMKGKRADWVQPLDPRAAELLRPIVEARRKAGKKTLSDIPSFAPAIPMRRFLDRLGIPKVHHGLRSTWITKAALSGVPQAVAMAFVHHAGEAVHRLYQRVRPDQSADFLSKISFGGK